MSPERETPELVGLAPAAVEAIALRAAELVVELLREDEPTPASPSPSGPLLWTTGRVASELGRSAEWVRDHRHELGEVRQPGKRPPLMFEAAAVRRWATARESSVRSEAEKPASSRGSSRGRRSRMSSGAPLLPIHGDRSAA